VLATNLRQSILVESYFVLMTNVMGCARAESARNMGFLAANIPDIPGSKYY